MAKTLTEIQTATRIHARDGDLTITSGDGLVSANIIYRRLASSFHWAELRRQDTSLSTTASTATYTWPTTNTFIDIKALEVQDDSDSDNYKMIFPPPDEWTWNQSGNKPNQVIPDHYMRISTSIADQVEFRPTPKIGSKTIRITGIIEPTALNQPYDKTVFIQKSADDAFEYLIAAFWTDRDGDPNWSAQLIQKARAILSQLFGKDQVPEELLRQVVQG